MSDEKIYCAAMIVIGNEILSGRTQDKNVQYLAQKLTDKGVRLSEVRVVPDIPDEIIASVQALSGKYDYVFTSGGIGPTHDDITAENVAKAFDVEIIVDPQARDILLDYYGEEELTDARLRMARIPMGAELVPNPVSGAPGFHIQNVYVMAGVPRIMQAMVDHIVPSLAAGVPLRSRTIESRAYESELAEGLGNIQETYPALDIGSYPGYGPTKSSVNIVIRGTDEKMLDKAESDVRALVKSLLMVRPGGLEPPLPKENGF